jgi:hypothetical protein
MCTDSAGNEYFPQIRATNRLFLPRGIVPTSANYPLGRIELDVCFGDQHNFRREKLEFEVMNLPSQYHAILRRPAFVRFMEVPHYTYLVLIIPGPKWGNNNQRNLRGLRYVRQRIPQNGTDLQHDGRICKT